MRQVSGGKEWKKIGVRDNLRAIMGGIAVSLMFLHVVYAMIRTWK